jgi:hypothetical protein
MKEDAMDFFKQKWVKITGFVLLIAGAAILILGGLTKEEVSKTVALVDGIIIAVGLLVTAIVSYVNGKELKKLRGS